MMKLTQAAQAISVMLGLSAGCIVTGSFINQPVLQDIGKLAGLGAISTGVLLKLNSLDAEKQKQLSKFQQENIFLQAKLSKTQNELNKLEKKVQTQSTCLRLYLSNIQKLQIAQIADEVIYLDDIQYKIAKYRKLDAA